MTVPMVIPSDWEWLYKTADMYEPRVAKAFIMFTDYLRENVTDKEILDAVLDPRISDNIVDWTDADTKLFEYLSPILADLVVKGGKKALRDVVKKQDPVELIGLFTVHNPKVEQWVKKHGLELVKDLNKNTREALKKVIYEAYNSGIHPKRLIPVISNSIGLTQKQAIAVNNYWKQLVQDGNKNADTLAVAYEKRLIKFRAETIARTETIAALQNGKKLAWDEMAERGLFKKEEAKREWIVTPDDRLCDRCRPLDGELTEYDKPFSIGVMNSPLHPRCRCDITLRFILEEAPETVLNPRQPFDISTFGGEETKRGTELLDLIDVENVKESANRSKRRIMTEIADALRDDEDFKHLVSAKCTGKFIYSEDATEEMVARLIENWAFTSGDNDALAIAMQLAAKEEFGLEYASIWFNESTIGIADYMYGEYKMGLRKFLRAMYNNTQNWFRKNGIEYVIVARGVSFASAPSEIRFLEPQILDTKLQPMSSFSASMATAKIFAANYAGSNEVRMILGARVPVDRILSTCWTGFGCKNEAEVVVLGGLNDVEKLWSFAWRYGDDVPDVFTIMDKWAEMIGG